MPRIVHLQSSPVSPVSPELTGGLRALNDFVLGLSTGREIRVQ